MTSPLKYCLPGIALFVFLLTACQKATIESKKENEFLSPPPPLCPFTKCNITDGGGFFHWFSWGTSIYEGELHFELSVQPDPYGFTYDRNDNPLNCFGEGYYNCYTKHLSSVFSYTNGKLSSILVDNTYSASGCPGYENLVNIHTGTRVDFTYTFRVEQIGSIPVFFPVINATVYKSDTVLLGQNFTSFTPTGRTYYYEYNISGDKLRIKRYKSNPSAITKEVRYTYDTVGHLIRTSQYENGIEKNRSTFYSFDTKRNYAAGNSIMKLLTSSYGTNNPKQWYNHSYTSQNTDYFTAAYSYNIYCYPAAVTITIDGFTFPNSGITYTCQ